METGLAFLYTCPGIPTTPQRPNVTLFRTHSTTVSFSGKIEHLKTPRLDFRIPMFKCPTVDLKECHRARRVSENDDGTPARTDACRHARNSVSSHHRPAGPHQNSSITLISEQIQRERRRSGRKVEHALSPQIESQKNRFPMLHNFPYNLAGKKKERGQECEARNSLCLVIQVYANGRTLVCK